MHTEELLKSGPHCIATEMNDGKVHNANLVLSSNKEAACHGTKPQHTIGIICSQSPDASPTCGSSCSSVSSIATESDSCASSYSDDSLLGLSDLDFIDDEDSISIGASDEDYVLVEDEDGESSDEPSSSDYDTDDAVNSIESLLS